MMLAPGERPDRLVTIEGGTYLIGTNEVHLPNDGEGPARKVRVGPFAIDPFAVTNAGFGAFVEVTGYVTEAERFGWSYVFYAFLPDDFPPTQAVAAAPWWRRVEGACWRRPEGPDSGIDDRAGHPVVHVSWNDAQAFAHWAGGRLPTEAEWEVAAHGGPDPLRFPWGQREPDDESFQPCNIWQGGFPRTNSSADGFAGTAPVDAFGANGHGLYNMAGNAWEWCADRFRVRSLKSGGKARDRAAVQAGERVLKGGSYLCHRSYCYRYRIAARSGNAADTTTGHIGLRLVYDP